MSYMRIVSREEFIARMTARQVKRRAEKAAAQGAVFQYFKDRDLRMRKLQNKNTASRYYKHTGK